MIPKFPQFKKLELSDKEDVEKFTSKYPPYSDFNFESIWSWDVNREMMISQHKDNLIVKFADYLTGMPFYTFLGKDMTHDTVVALLLLSKQEGLELKLKLIPEDSIEILKNLELDCLKVEEDRDNFDYVYLTKSLKDLIGPEYYTKRSEIARYLRKHDNIISKKIDITDPEIRQKIHNLNQEWCVMKLQKDPYFDIKNELKALENYVENPKFKSFAIGIFKDKELISYSLNVILSDEYAIGHFFKNNQHGLFDYLMHQTCKHLYEANVKYLNFEQDLGIAGLRKSKLSYRPIHFLRKFNVTCIAPQLDV